jgi:GNAT superfamily N-acetyltransferase
VTVTENLLRVACFELQYAAYNAQRSLGTPDTHHAEVRATSQGVHIRCPAASENAYLNRLVSTERPQVSPEGVHQVDRIGHDSVGASLRILTACPRAEGTPTTVPVRRYNATQATEFLAIVASTIGQVLDEEVVAAKKRFYCSQEFRCFVAGTDDAVEGIATTFVLRDMGWLANAYTFPAARRRGVHRALLEVRLADARALGLREVFTDVVPGSDSERNLLRAGFRHVAYYSSEDSGPGS